MRFTRLEITALLTTGPLIPLTLHCTSVSFNYIFAILSIGGYYLPFISREIFQTRNLTKPHINRVIHDLKPL